MALFDDFWGAIGDVASVMSFWSSLRSVCDVQHRRTIPDPVLLLTYISMFGSTLSGFCYALPFADGDWETFSPWFLAGELVSYLLTSYYVKVFFYRCAPTLRWCACYGFCFLATPCVMLCFFTIAILNPTEKSRIAAKKASGWLYAVLSCIMYLMTLIQIMMQSGMSLLQKCQSVSVWSVGTNSMSCFIWFTYAVLNGDIFTLVPNIVGLIVSIVLYIMCACGREHPVAVGPVAADHAAGPVAADHAAGPVAADHAAGPVAADPAASPVAADPAASPVAANPATTGPVAADPAAADLVAADPAAADPALIAAAPALAAIAASAHVAATHAAVTVIDSARIAAIAATNSAHAATARATIAATADSARAAACVAIVNPVATAAIVAARAAATTAADSARAGAAAYAARTTAAARAAARDPAPG